MDSLRKKFIMYFYFTCYLDDKKVPFLIDMEFCATKSLVPRGCSRPISTEVEHIPTRQSQLCEQEEIKQLIKFT